MGPRHEEGILVNIGSRYREQQVSTGGQVPIYAFARLYFGMRGCNNLSKPPNRCESMGVGRRISGTWGSVKVEVAEIGYFAKGLVGYIVCRKPEPVNSQENVIRRKIFGDIVSNDDGWMVRAGAKLGDARNTQRDVRLLAHVMQIKARAQSIKALYNTGRTVTDPSSPATA
jgi:hypothetical protein